MPAGTTTPRSGSRSGLRIASSSAGDTSVHPVAAGLPVRPYGDPVLALLAVRHGLHEDAHQRQLEDRRRALQPRIRIVGVDDRPVIDRLAPVRRAEHPAADGAAQQHRAALRADLLGHHGPERPRELPRPVDG